MTTGKEKYTVEEAASMLAKETGERESELFSRLDAAVLSGDLPAYPRGSKLKINYGAQSTYGRCMQPRGYQEYVYWHDLNKWISENCRLLDYRFPDPAAPVVADGTAKPRSNKSEETLIFEAKVLELLGKFWDDRPPDTKPFKHELCKRVYDEMLRGTVRSKRGISMGSVEKAAKQWSMPIVLSAYVPEATYDEKQHPFKR